MKLYELRMMLYIDSIREEFCASELVVAVSYEDAKEMSCTEVAGRMLEALNAGADDSPLNSYWSKYIADDPFTYDELRRIEEECEGQLGYRYSPDEPAEVALLDASDGELYRVAIYDRDSDEWLEYNNHLEEIDHLKKCINESLALQDQLEEELKSAKGDLEFARGLIMKYHQTLGKIDDLATQIGFLVREEEEEE